MATAKKNGLGKGLDSLITNKVNTTKTTTATTKQLIFYFLQKSTVNKEFFSKKYAVYRGSVFLAFLELLCRVLILLPM